jgi:curli biogenesis system outer membrane secretion channel CsgG
MRYYLFALLLPILSACTSTPTTTVQVLPAAQANPYQTFNIRAIRTSGHRQDLELRFSQALEHALTAKGYRFDAALPDMQVIYALGLEQEQGIALTPVTVGGTVYTQTRATDDERARLALRILDSKTQAVLFQAQISRQLHNPDMSQENFNRGVAKILEGFPAAR